ncbi:MAG: PspA/IM30 family protein [Gemmatimonadota bacterium]
MFNRLKQAIDRALSSLESRSGGPERDVEELLRSMREELIDAKAHLPKLEATLLELEAARAAEEQKAQECGRRALQADEIGDRETVEVALQYEAKHRGRAEVFVQKIEAAQAEFALQQQTVRDMTRQLKEATASRGTLEARSRRARATQNLRGGGESAADEFDRLANEIEDDVMDAEVGAELDDVLGGRASRVDPEDLADVQLEELKRRMAEESGGPST